MARYFVALLPSQEIQVAARQIQQHFTEQYASRKAQNSPPHITLQSPFEWPAEQVPILEQGLSTFAQNHQPVPIKLSGFGAFAPRVIYIGVLKTPELLALQVELSTYFVSKFKITDSPAKKRAYTPHLTVAFRDLTRTNFRTAWAEFQHQPLQFECVVATLTLLMHNSRSWVVSKDLPFSHP